jgi:hypothetical protein
VARNSLGYVTVVLLQCSFSLLICLPFTWLGYRAFFAMRVDVKVRMGKLRQKLLQSTTVTVTFLFTSQKTLNRERAPAC